MRSETVSSCLGAGDLNRQPRALLPWKLSYAFLRVRWFCGSQAHCLDHGPDFPLHLGSSEALCVQWWHQVMWFPSGPGRGGLPWQLEPVKIVAVTVAAQLRSCWFGVWFPTSPEMAAGCPELKALQRRQQRVTGGTVGYGCCYTATGYVRITITLFIVSAAAIAMWYQGIRSDLRSRKMMINVCYLKTPKNTTC